MLGAFGSSPIEVRKAFVGWCRVRERERLASVPLDALGDKWPLWGTRPGSLWRTTRATKFRRRRPSSVRLPPRPAPPLH